MRRPLLLRRITGAVAAGGASALIVFAGCGGGAAHADRGTAARAVAAPVPTVTAAGRPATRTGCARDVALALGQVAANAYEQAAGGRNVVSARRRLARSRRLARAVAHGDARATQAALAPLIKHQIVRIEVSAGGRRLAAYGATRALAPVGGEIRDGGRVVGRYVMSVSGDRALSGIVAALTGGRVVLGPGAVSAGRGATVVAFEGRRFPAGRLRISTILPHAVLTACGASPAQTRTRAIGAVGRRLLDAESHGSAVHRVLHVVGTDPGLSRAVAADDPAALRRAVLRLFKDRNLHVVRIAASLPDGRRVGDVGGPYALAPASGPVTTPDGRRVGTVTLSVQDDTGYIKLMHRFTGAAVQLQLASGLVPGSTLEPGPPSIPDRGTVVYRGRTYGVYAFTAVAFLGDRLRISLLVPAVSPARHAPGAP